MKIVFKDKALQELIETGTTDDRRYRKYTRDTKFMDALRRKIATIKMADTYDTLHSISFLHYERLKHEHSGLTSFRVSNRHVERVICREHDEYIELTIIELDDTHYGNKR